MAHIPHANLCPAERLAAQMRAKEQEIRSRTVVLRKDSGAKRVGTDLVVDGRVVVKNLFEEK